MDNEVKGGAVVDILMVEDNDADARLTEEALKEGSINCRLSRVQDGLQAMAFLRREHPYEHAPRPNLILLDLNMPKMDGMEVLTILRGDEDLSGIPVVVLTTSSAEEDIAMSYSLKANCYIKKPVDFDQFIDVVREIEHFWFSVASLPRNGGR